VDAAEPAAIIRAHATDDCCMFTTTGRISGRPHRVEIWFGVLDDVVYLISGNGPSADWYRNALEHPEVTVELGEQLFWCTARVVSDAHEGHRVGELMGAKYQWDGDPSIGLTRDAWCFEVPVLAVHPADAR
jgi:deazaflavin-dependent oxidoreductase (nitroreductase family)